MSFIRSRSASAVGASASAVGAVSPPVRAQSDSDVLRSDHVRRSVGDGYVILHQPEPSDPQEAQHNSAVQQEIDAATRELELLEQWLSDRDMLHLKTDIAEAFITADYPASDWVQTLSEMEEHSELEVFIDACTKKKEHRVLSEVASKMPAELWRLVLTHAALAGPEHHTASAVCRIWRQVVLAHTPVKICLKLASDAERALAWACQSLGDWTLRLKIPQLLLNEPLSQRLAIACSSGSALRRIDVRTPVCAATGNKLLSLVQHSESNRLRCLEMAGSFLGTPGGHGLAACLRSNRIVETYGFASNFVGPDAGAAIAASLETPHCSVTSLDLRRNGLATGAAALGVALAKNVRLTTLLLGENELGPDGGAAVANGLRSNRTLTCLDLAKNALGDDGAIALAEALRANAQHSKLRSLDLQSNNIGTPAAQAWAAVLSNKASGSSHTTHGKVRLRFLNLNDNPSLLPLEHRGRSAALDAPTGGTAAALACEMAVEELISAMDQLGGACCLMQEGIPPMTL
jgi:hypothetical protein